MRPIGVTGVLGDDWRADVSAWGAVVPWDRSPSLDWHVAADDRWHTPATETAVRQHRLSGAPVFETRLRVPGGDAVQRVWSVAGDGGWTLVEVANESPLPFACAFTRGDVVTNRPPADVRIEGIDLVPDSVVLPVGHRASVTVGLRHTGATGRALPGSVERPEAVARGWIAVAERAGRLVLPDAALVEAVVAARCDLLLAGPPSGDEDPAGFLLAVGELVRLGEVDRDGAAALAADVASAAQHVARHAGWDGDAALAAAAFILHRADEARAVADVDRIAAARQPAGPPTGPEYGIRAVALAELTLTRGPVLFPSGIPPAWRGSDIEAHGLVAGPATTLSFAVRWHGEHPAVLWQLQGQPVELRAPAVDPTWRTTAASGEALWRAGSS